MKAFEIPSDAKHVLLLQEKDRIVVLEKNQTALVLGNNETDETVAVSVHLPHPPKDENAPLPLSVVMAACVKEFLQDLELVKLIQNRIEQQSKAENKEDKKA